MKKITLLFFCTFLTVSCAAPKPIKNRVQNPEAVHYQEILATDVNFDQKSGEITYTLPEEALVRIRIGLRDGGPLIRTLVDWETRKKGTTKERWDKRDASGNIVSDHSNLLIVMASIVPAKGKKSSIGDIKGFRKSPNFNVIFPSAELNDEKIPVFKKVVPIKITLDEKDKEWITRTKYEISFFFDHVVLFEEEEGTSPYTFLFNTTGINEGEHFLTVNLIGYDGEIGTRTFKIFVSQSQ